MSAGALAERERRLNEVYLAGRISKTDYDREWQEIKELRAQMSERPAPLFTQQRQILGTLVDKWDGMTNDDRTRMLAGILDSITASAVGIDRMEPTEDWCPYLIAAIPSPIGLSAERKTGLGPSVAHRSVSFREGWLELAA